MADPSTLNIETSVCDVAHLRAEIERGQDYDVLWTTLHQLVVNVSTRNAVLSEIFRPRDIVMSTAIVRETDLPTRREKHKFFRDVAFRRQNDDVNLRQRIKRRLIAPLYDVIVGLEPIATGRYREARCGRHRQFTLRRRSHRDRFTQVVRGVDGIRGVVAHTSFTAHSASWRGSFRLRMRCPMLMPRPSTHCSVIHSRSPPNRIQKRSRGSESPLQSSQGRTRRCRSAGCGTKVADMAGSPYV
jgi:hypothetical protein